MHVIYSFVFLMAVFVEIVDLNVQWIHVAARTALQKQWVQRGRCWWQVTLRIAMEGCPRAFNSLDRSFYEKVSLLQSAFSWHLNCSLLLFVLWSVILQRIPVYVCYINVRTRKASSAILCVRIGNVWPMSQVRVISVFI